LRASMSVTIRSLGWSESMGLSCNESEFRKGFTQLVMEVLRWTRKDGSLLLSPHRGDAGASFQEFWSTAFRIAGRPKTLGHLMASRLPKRSAVSTKGSEKKLPNATA